jgi:hypothetical protein
MYDIVQKRPTARKALRLLYAVTLEERSHFRSFVQRSNEA